MARGSIVWGVLVMGCAVQALAAGSEDNPPEYMGREERESLKEEARDMFYHAYNAYMDNAYPADELMPLSCKGRYRGSEPDRGDIDSTLGNFSLTLVDTLDTLVVLGDLEEFENAVRLVVEDVKFDTDVIVSLFETNIRMLGGLLSGHILAEYLQLRADIMPWYRGELLDLAKDLGYRFLPAFNTTTGIPFGRINLMHGMKGVPAEMCRETCTACAGSMILEMAALSRLTGESIFEEKAQKAMDALWKMRHRGTDLMGSVLNVHSGDWVRRDSGVGAGIDSYYEYCLKAYILLGDEKYLGRFNKHYQAVMKYVSQGPMLLDVHMHRPNTNSKNFMDALLAFWPGLQVLKGDIKPAVETHEMLYQVMQRHNFIPEAFTTDFQVHWGHHPLRPEFLESTYFLYRATGDHYYLGVGRKVLKSLQTYARVTCGYAAVSDVRTNKHDDTMDSFVLSETFKYLFLLFAEPNDLVLDLDEFIFTTEGHLLPLTLAAVRTNVTADLDRDIVHVEELDRTCPNSLHLFPASVRQPLRNMVEDVCPRRSLKRRLNASQFQANNLEHLKILGNMGITILTLADGRVQLLHTFSNARTAQDAEEGLLFMQEMVELSRKQSQQSETRPHFVAYVRNDMTPPQEVTLLAGPAHFGPGFKDGSRITGKVEFASPSEACSDLVEPEKLVGKVVMMARGNCMFVEKARRIQKAGAIAGIVLDTVVGSSASVSPMFAMSGDGKEPDDVTIPVVFLFNKEATELVVSHIANDGLLTVTLGDFPRDEVQLKAPGDLSVFERLKGSLKDFLVRQISSQNSGSTSRPVGAPASAESEVDTGKTTPVEHAIPVEYAHLKALIYKDRGVVKIEKPGPATFRTRSSPENVNHIEKTWHSMKQDLVNRIYSRSNPMFVIPIEKVQFYYKTIHKLRGLDTILPVEKLSLWLLIRWLLKELSEVKPDLLATFSEDSADGKKSFEPAGLEELIEKTDPVETGNVMEMNTEWLLREVAASIQLRKDILRKMAANDELQESISQIIHSNSPDFKPQTSAAAKTDEDNLDTDVELSYGHLKARIGDRVVKFERSDDNPGEIIQPAGSDKFEENWYKWKQDFVNLMYSRREPTLEIPTTVLKDYLSAYTLQDPNRRHSDESFKDMTAWLLKEFSQVKPDPREVGSYVLRRMRHEFQPPFDRELIGKRFAEELAALDVQFPYFFRDLNSDYIRKAVEEAVKLWTSVETMKSDNAEAKNIVKNDSHDRRQIVVSYRHLKGTIFEDEGVVIYGRTDVSPPDYGPEIVHPRVSRMQDALMQSQISYMYSQPEPFLKHTIAHLRFFYELSTGEKAQPVAAVRSRSETSDRLEDTDMVLWFLKELSNFRPDPEQVGSFVLSRLRQLFKAPFDRKAINERFSDELIALDVNFYNFYRGMSDDYLHRQVEAAVKRWTNEETKSKIAANDDETIEIDKSGSQDDNNATKEKNNERSITGAKDDSYRDKKSSEDESAAGDSLEELKKPVWAPEEAKKSPKSSSRLQEKHETSDNRDDTANKRHFEHSSEYTKSNREAKTRRIDKHIDDEL